MSKKGDILIDPDFEAMIPPCTPEELSQLEGNLLADGCRDPLVAWLGTGALLDGHQRYKLCKKHHLPYKVRWLRMDSRDDAIIWIIHNQFGRRNLTAFQRAELALKLKPMIEAKARERQLAATRLSKTRKGQKVPGTPIKTLEEVGKIAKLSRSYLHRAERVSEMADDDLKERLRTGEAKVCNEYKRLRGLPTGSMWIELRQEIQRLRMALDSLRQYEPPVGQGWQDAFDHLQDMAARALNTERQEEPATA